MRRFLRWLLGINEHVVVSAVVDGFHDALKRIDDVEDDLEHLGRRFTKLQTQVTRAWRDVAVPEELDDDDDEDAEFNRLLDEKRRARG
jgi:hypothetical protein